MAVVLVFIACLVPSLIFFFWLRSRNREKPEYVKTCNRALFSGMFSSIPIILSALVLNLIGVLAGLKKMHWIVWGCFETFVLYALTEELFKFLFSIRVLKKTECEYSWYDVTAFMTLVGIGFGLFESILYAFTLGMIEAVIRGFILGHGVYGFIMGYFYAKALNTGKKSYFVLSFAIPYIFHALYDFSLIPQLTEYNDNLAIIAVLLALADLVVMIIMIVFFARRRRNEKYNKPLF